MTTISEAVDQVKKTAMKLAEVRKELIAAKEVIERWLESNTQLHQLQERRADL